MKWIRPLAFGVCALSVAAVASLWWSGSSELLLRPSSGSAFIAIGRLAGLFAQLAILFQFILIARLPPLEREFGFVGMNRIHRVVGGWLAATIVLHPLFLSMGYGGLTFASAWRQFAAFVTQGEHVLLALVGFSILIASAVVSIRHIRGRVPYEWWHIAHLGMYVAAVMIFFHQLNGSDIARSTFVSAWWIALNVFALGAVLTFRVLRPLYLAARHRFRVAEVRRETDDVASVIITGNDMDRFRFEPGQHAKISFLTGWHFAPHPFSFSTVPNGKSVRFSIKALGDFTSRVPKIPPGTRVIIDGPLGAFTARRAETDKMLFIAGGIGITPVFSMIESLAGSDRDLILLYANQSIDAAALKPDIERVQRNHPRLRVVLFVERNDGGTHPFAVEEGRITEAAIRRLVPDAAERTAFVCGPPAMMRAVESALLAIGIPKRRIHDERFALSS